MSPEMTDDQLQEIGSISPVAVIDRDAHDCPAVLIPATDGMTQAVEHLHALGHRRITYLAGPKVYSNATRAGAFRTACERLAIDRIEIDLDDARFSAGVRGGDLVLATGATAAIAYNDEVAVGLLNRLAHRDVAVPADVSVIGFDDTGLAEMVVPLLTTVRLPATAAGAAAVRMLLDQVNGRQDGAAARLHLGSELVIRATTAPPGASRRHDGGGA